MDFMQFIVDNINQLGVGDSYQFLIFLAISFLVGIITLTWVYVLNYKNKEDHDEWNKEPLLNKIIISLILGVSVYLTILMLRIIVQKINPAVIQPSIFNFSWILLSIIYSAGISSVPESNYLKIIKKSLEITSGVTIISLVLLGILQLNSSPIFQWSFFILGVGLILVWIDKEANWKLFIKK